MPRPIVNLDELDMRDHGHGNEFQARLGAIGQRVGAKKMGCMLIEVPPGKRAFPFHSHNANEEMFVILEGSGEVRIGGSRHPIRKGDLIACPPGGPESAHQIINTGREVLRYLGISTMIRPELAEYPDSGKFGFRADIPDGESGDGRAFWFIGREGGAVDYWDGE
jgi:uncharacterized cupin superfamily protein